MELLFSGEIWWWRGPAPFHFVTVPENESAAIHDVAELVTYGWGMIPASVTVGRTTVTTSLWPKDGGYIVPLTKKVRDAEGLELGATVEIALSITGGRL